MDKQPPKLFKTRKEKITALILTAAATISVLSFIYALTQQMEAHRLKVELDKCKGVEVTE